jgi:hypothetical protein
VDEKDRRGGLLRRAVLGLAVGLATLGGAAPARAAPG